MGVERLEERVLLSASLIQTIDTLPLGSASFSGATTVGTKAIFAENSRFDIYDNATGQWSSASISHPRSDIGAATVGSKAIFAGGGHGGFGQSNAVDIYDDKAGLWSTASLPAARDLPVVVTVGSKVLIAGGYSFSRTVDVYDDATGAWSVMTFPKDFRPSAGTVIGNLALFTGTYNADNTPSNLVYVYNDQTGGWKTMRLPVAEIFNTATTAGSKALFAGGAVEGGFSSVVDVYDAKTDRWSTANLSQARFVKASTSIANLALFPGGLYGTKHGYHSSYTVDIYDAQTNQWSTAMLTQARDLIGVTAVGDKVIFAGGYDWGDHGPNPERSRVDIFTLDALTPTAQLIQAANRKQSRQSFTFTVSYHGDYKIDPGSLDDNDIIVNGPNGFEGHARLISQSRNTAGNTRIGTYAIDGPGNRWDASDNGLYTIHLQDRQVLDIEGDQVVGRKLGAFSVEIATTPGASISLPVPRATAFQTQRKVDSLWES